MMPFIRLRMRNRRRTRWEGGGRCEWKGDGEWNGCLCARNRQQSAPTRHKGLKNKLEKIINRNRYEYFNIHRLLCSMNHKTENWNDEMRQKCQRQVASPWIVQSDFYSFIYIIVLIPVILFIIFPTKQANWGW